LDELIDGETELRILRGVSFQTGGTADIRQITTSCTFKWQDISI